MTDTAGPFDGTPWAEAQWARHAAMWAPSGVYGTPAASTTTGDLPLSVSALTVGLGAGRAWVRGFGFERSGAAVMQAVSANTHASFSRRDRIVLRRNLATHTITAVVLTGTPASPPVAPALTQSEAGSWDLPLFSFLVPPNSGTTITGVIDERPWIGPDGTLYPAPQPVTLAGGWTSTVAPKCFYTAGRMVQLTGRITNNLAYNPTAAAATAFTLPAGYWPSSVRTIVVGLYPSAPTTLLGSVDTSGQVQIGHSGNVTIPAGQSHYFDTAFFYLD